MPLHPRYSTELTNSIRMEFGSAFASKVLLVAVFDAQGAFVTANDSWLKLLNRTLASQWAKSIYDFFESGAAAAIERSLHKVAHGQVEHLNLKLVPGHSESLFYDFVLSPLFKDGAFSGFHLSANLAPPESTNIDLPISGFDAQQTFEEVDEAILITNAGGHIIYANPVAELMLGRKSAAYIGVCIDTVLSSGGADLWRRNQKHDSAIASTIELEFARPDGLKKSVKAIVVPIYDNQNEERGYIVIVHNGHRSLEIAESLSYQATHDHLTGLTNRKELERNLTHALEETRHFNRQHVLCYVDLDLFKIINDNYSYRTGDALLCQVARELERSVRQSDVVSRIGGDEFAILLTDCEEETCTEIVEKIRARIHNMNFQWDDAAIDCTASIGLVVIDSGTPSVSAALSAVDTACAIAKDKGRNRIQHFLCSDQQLARRRGDIEWVDKIRRALDEQRFRLYYQPIVPIQDPSQGARAEILVRMVDGEGKIISPTHFIPAAEHYNLMHRIDRWVVDQTLNFCEVFKNQSSLNHIETFAINISGGSLADEKFMDYVFERIKNSHIQSDSICFEITETYAINNMNGALSFIRKLKKLGCRFALDDFGSGYSSFSYLKNLPVDYLKIDGCFIRDLVSNPVDYAMVESIHRVGQVMNIKTVAEFVENEHILKAVADIGIDYAQGYAISMPQPLYDDQDWE